MLDFVFRLDANSQVGAGHFTRCLAVIEALLRRGFSVCVVGDIDPSYRERLADTCVVIRGTQIPDCRCIVIDWYGELPSIFNNLVPKVNVVLFEDLDTRSSTYGIDADMLVINAFANQQLVSKNFPGSKVITGLESLLFREEIRDLKEAVSVKALRPLHVNADLAKNKSILLTLGAAQTAAQVKSVLTKIEQAVDDTTKIIVTGNYSKLSTRAETYLLNSLQQDFISCVESAWFVVCGAGQTLIEMTYCGIPTLGLVLANNQINCAKQLETLGVPIVFNLETLSDELQVFIKKRPDEYGFSNDLGVVGAQAVGSRSRELIEKIALMGKAEALG